MKVNFLNQKPCIPSWPGVFQLFLFLCVIWVNRFVFLLSSLLRALLILLSYGLSIRIFCYVFLVAIFLFKIVHFLFYLVVGMFLRHLLPFVGRIFFRVFGMSCFVFIVLPFVDISLILLLLPVLSGLFPQVVLLCLCYPFFFVSACSCGFPLFSHFGLFSWIFSSVSSKISYPGFDFFFVLFEEISIFFTK